MATTVPAGFGALLKRYRVAAVLSQEELAERAKLSVEAISALERGVRRHPYWTTARLLADALGLQWPRRASFEATARGKSPGSATLDTRGAPGHLVPPFVGRSQEVALLERYLAGAGGPPVLLLAGEPGIGKTRLLHETTERAARTGWTVLAGGGQRRGGANLYAPLLETLHRHLRGQETADRRMALQGCAWLVRLLPELAGGPIEPLPPWTLPPEQQRRLMFEAVGQYLANVAGPVGTLLVLDDLQWADQDALELLAALARSATEVPLRIVGAYRDTEVRPEDPLSVTLADLAHAGLAARRLLGPLTPHEAAQLLEGFLEGMDDGETALRERVLRRAGGVPFFVVSCAQELRLGDSEMGGQDAVPWDVAHSVRQRVAALPARERELLGTAAIVGREVTHSLLATVTAHPEEDVLAALDAACQARLMEETEEQAYRFAHDVIREVVEADLGTGRRMLLHRHIAEALERGCSRAIERGELPVEVLAYHYTRSDAADKAILYLEQAGDRARLQAAWAAAESYYTELVHRLEGRGQALDGARVREKLGAVLYAAARFDAALAVLEEAAKTYRAAEDLESVGRTVAQMGHVYAWRGTPEPGVVRLAPLLEPLAASGPSRGLAALHVALAHLFFVSGQYSEQLAVSERAAEMARALEDDQMRTYAEGRRGLALATLGHLREALPVYEETIRLAERGGDRENLARALGNVAVVYSYMGEFDRSRQYCERALTVVEQHSDRTQGAYWTAMRGKLAILGGGWREARADFARATAMVREMGACWPAVYPLIHQGELSLREGAWDEASGCLDAALRLLAHGQDLQALRWAQRVLAECDVLEGRPDAALARLAPLLDRPGLEEVDVTEMLPLVAWARLARGDVGQAREVVTQALRRAQAQHYWRALPDGLRVQAMVAMRQDQCIEAAQALDEGLTLARSMSYPYAAARLLSVYGALHASQGEPRQARERLEAARAIFRRLGARHDAERAEHALMALS